MQVAVYRGADLVIDAVAGVADPATGRQVTPDTLFYNFSIGKGAASTIVHVLAERGSFGYDTPVADLWPEFGALEDLCNWDKMCAVIADEELWWEPGTKVGYHAYSFGYIVAEISRLGWSMITSWTSSVSLMRPASRTRPTELRSSETGVYGLDL